jgi:hypothetical protein
MNECESIEKNIKIVMLPLEFVKGCHRGGKPTLLDSRMV